MPGFWRVGHLLKLDIGVKAAEGLRDNFWCSIPKRRNIVNGQLICHSRLAALSTMPPGLLRLRPHVLLRLLSTPLEQDQVLPQYYLLDVAELLRPCGIRLEL